MNRAEGREEQELPEITEPASAGFEVHNEEQADPEIDDRLHRQWRLDKAPVRSVSHSFCG